MTNREVSEYLENGNVIDIRFLEGEAHIKMLALRTSDSKIENTIQENIKKGNGPTISKDILPKEFMKYLKNPTKTQTKLDNYPSRTIEQPVQAPQPPSNDGFPFLPLAIVGAAAIGGAAYYGSKLQESVTKGTKQPKRYKGKGNEQYGMPNKDADSTDSFEIADKIAEQRLKLKQAEQFELTALNELRILEQALELEVNDGLRTNSVAYKKAKAEIDQKKAEFDRKYLS